MTLRQQMDQLVSLGVAELAGISSAAFGKLADGLDDDGVVCVHPDLVAPSLLAPLLRHDAKPGFVVEDMTDLDEFGPIGSVHLPDRPVYLVRGVDGGDDLLDWTPNAALSETLGRGRTQLTISEGLSWLLQDSGRLEANRCFMCVGSRNVTARGVDARTPAIWISRVLDATVLPDATPPRWAGAGPGTTTRGWASPRPRAASDMHRVRHPRVEVDTVGRMSTGEVERTAEQFFDGFPGGLKLYAAVEGSVRDIGDASVHVTKSQIAFRRRKAFAYVSRPGQ